MVIKIEVTEEDILNGVRESAQACPIALAVMRCGGFEDVNVCDDGELGVDWFPGPAGGGYAHIFKAPMKAVKFIERFDAGKPVKPFTFALRELKG